MMRYLISIVCLLILSQGCFAKPLAATPEVWIVGQLLNHSNINWPYQLQLVPTSKLIYVKYSNIDCNGTKPPPSKQQSGCFRLALSAQATAKFQLVYNAYALTDEYHRSFYDKIDRLCSFTVSTSSNGKATLTVRTLPGSYVKCALQQDKTMNHLTLALYNLQP